MGPHRNMTIEEVSVLFDTGRKGDAQAAARSLGQTGKKFEDEGHGHAESFEMAGSGKGNAIAHVENVGGSKV